MGIEIIDLIERLQRRKRAAHTVPEHVTDIELWRELHAVMHGELNRLYKEGRIGYHRTLNGWTTHIKDLHDEDNSTDNG